MPWERQPSWMYLPHLLDRAEDRQRDKAGEQRPEGERSSGSGGGNVGMDRELPMLRRAPRAAAKLATDPQGMQFAGNALCLGPRMRSHAAAKSTGLHVRLRKFEGP